MSELWRFSFEALWDRPGAFLMRTRMTARMIKKTKNDAF